MSGLSIRFYETLSSGKHCYLVTVASPGGVEASCLTVQQGTDDEVQAFVANPSRMTALSWSTELIGLEYDPAEHTLSSPNGDIEDDYLLTNSFFVTIPADQVNLVAEAIVAAVQKAAAGPAASSVAGPSSGS